MIYTVTFNPAVDYAITTNTIINGAVNRTKDEHINFGGKGINVSLVLKRLKTPSVVLGFVGGFTGEALCHYLTQEDIVCDFVKIKGNTRINVKLNDTDINACGPDILDSDIMKLFYKLDNIKKGDFLVLSGSVQKSVPKNIYALILERLKNKGINIVIDAETQLLLPTLKYNPFLIKPNHHELSEIFATQINDFDTAILYAKKLQQMGGKNVMVSMGEKGGVLLDEGGTAFTQAAPNGTVISAVGAGDSMVAAFLAQYLKSGDYKDCLKLAVAAGSATAFSYGLANHGKIKEIYNNM